MVVLEIEIRLALDASATVPREYLLAHLAWDGLPLTRQGISPPLLDIEENVSALQLPLSAPLAIME